MISGRRFRTWAKFALGFLCTGLLGSCNGDGSSRTTTIQSPVLEAPARVSAAGTDLLVSDYGGQAVVVMGKDDLGIRLRIPVQGRPTGVAQAAGLLVIGNRDDGSVSVYSPRGVFSHYLGSGPGEFQQPNDLAVDEGSGLVYVVDTRAKAIKVYNLTDGTAAGTVGGGSLFQPTALALDPLDGEILVSDFGEGVTPARVSIFTAAGVFDRAIPAANGPFSTPQGLYADLAGRIFLVDALSGEVLVFDGAGSLLKVLGGIGTGNGELFYPLDVLLDEGSQDLFVTDNRNGRLAVFRGGGVIP